MKESFKNSPRVLVEKNHVFLLPKCHRELILNLHIFKSPITLSKYKSWRITEGTLNGNIKHFVTINSRLISFLFFNFIGYFVYLHFKCYPYSWFPLQTSQFHTLPPASRMVLNSPTPSCPTNLAFPYAGASSLHRTNELYSH